MQAVSPDSMVPELTPEETGISAGLKSSPVNVGTIEKFANNMADNIIQSLLGQTEMVEPEVDWRFSSFNQDPETLAEELASVVIEAALREACRSQNIEDHVEGFQNSRPTGVKTDGGQASSDESGREKDVSDVELQASRDTQPCHPPLSQSGLPIVGSLDYPDAPPTTPLLPELERSRHSFARKLKGGLAKEFLPSPPPPTPKDQEDDSGVANDDPQVELMEHLMHSLSINNISREYFEGGPQLGTVMETFAESLSYDIIDRALRAKSREQKADGSDLHLFAHQLAETIITSSIDEAKMLV
ncbi:A-kinase anchor protein 11 [Thunnus albacares]|uniref:A-kinase anchor protein 11 n=1 Tax=Thunnus albacares TaxID=8236 RepID=UPI001CF60911|nr:A-kinase anchor protein 11 [Thunnus albacares]